MLLTVLVLVFPVSEEGVQPLGGVLPAPFQTHSTVQVRLIFSRPDTIKITPAPIINCQISVMASPPFPLASCPRP